MNVIPFPCNRTRIASKRPKRTSTTKRAARSGPTAREIELQLNSPPEGFDINFEEIAHLTEGAANESNDNPVVLSGRAELALRRLIARFGFERLPQTYGELHGLTAYCFDLQHYADLGTTPDEVTLIWQQSARKVLAEHFPALLPAFELLVAGDLPGLRELHRREDTLTRLGREYSPDA